MCTILPPEFLQLGNVGLPSLSVEIKLVDVPEAGYKANADQSQGEIWICGTSVTKGYYKWEDLNSDPFHLPWSGMVPYRRCRSIAERRHHDHHRPVSVTALILVDPF